MKIKRVKTQRLSINTKVIEDIKDPYTLGVYVQLLHYSGSEEQNTPEGYLKQGLKLVEAIENLERLGYIIDEGNHVITLLDIPDSIYNESYLNQELSTH